MFGLMHAYCRIPCFTTSCASDLSQGFLLCVTPLYKSYCLQGVFYPGAGPSVLLFHIYEIQLYKPTPHNVYVCWYARVFLFVYRCSSSCIVCGLRYACRPAPKSSWQEHAGSLGEHRSQRSTGYFGNLGQQHAGVGLNSLIHFNGDLALHIHEHASVSVVSMHVVMVCVLYALEVFLSPRKHPPGFARGLRWVPGPVSLMRKPTRTPKRWAAPRQFGQSWTIACRRMTEYNDPFGCRSGFADIFPSAFNVIYFRCIYFQGHLLQNTSI